MHDPMKQRNEPIRVGDGDRESREKQCCVGRRDGGRGGRVEHHEPPHTEPTRDVVRR